MSDAIKRLNAALEGRYRVEREIGEGGMATVFLARDLKHNRHVALKVLKPELAAVVGAERFLAEIETTANLQHPHILPLYDSGEADSLLFYVMPYVEGETLRDRLEREKQLPVDEAVRIAADVAEALHSAHEQGVIHRDIKPANILMSKGRPLVADFGIALAVSASGGGRLTETGLSMGTPYYMSPEQASADREPSAASDVYSLGCVLYEMLVGEPPYTGGSAQAVLAKILMGDASAPTTTRSSIPENVDAAIRKSLEKLPADRFKGVDDFAKALADSGFRHGAAAASVASTDATRLKRLSIATGSLAALLALALGWALLRPVPPAGVERFQSPFSEGQEPTGPFALTPDGSALVYVGLGESGEGTRLWIRSWNQLDARPIPGTAGVSPDRRWGLALSPEGREVAFVHGSPGWSGIGGPLRVVSLAGGPSRTLAEDALSAGWSDDGWVYFTTLGYAIDRVRESGGPSEAVTQRAEDELFHFSPQPLPGGRHLLFGVFEAFDGSDAAVWSLDLETRERKLLTPGTNPRYTTTGHLLFTLDGRLMAAPFDARRAELTGDAVAVAEGLGTDISFGSFMYSSSVDGSLVYQGLEGGWWGAGGGQSPREFVWVTRSGEATPVNPGETLLWPPLGHNDGLRLSPDGRRVAFTNFTGGNVSISTKQLPDGPMSRLTFETAQDQNPVWTPDGRSITFSSTMGSESGRDDIYCCLWTIPANGAGEAEFVYGDSVVRAGDGVWSPDGKWLVMRRNPSPPAAPTSDIIALRPGVDSAANPLIATQFTERDPAISRDGRWLAYASDEGGRNEVFVRPFPDVNDGKWQVSTGGGVQPVWAHKSSELFFLNSAGELEVAEFTTTADVFVTGRVTALFDVLGSSERYGPFPEGTRFYDVALDDQRFLMTRRVGAEDVSVRTPIIVVLNFFEELKRLVPN